MYLQTVKMIGGFHTQIRTRRTGPCLAMVSTFKTVTRAPGLFRLKVLCDRYGLSVWAGHRFSTCYWPRPV